MKILYVVPKADMVSERKALLGEHFDVIPIAANLSGVQYDEIWIDEDYQHIYGDNVQVAKQAYEQVETLWTRLVPHGRMRFLQ